MGGSTAEPSVLTLLFINYSELDFYETFFAIGFPCKHCKCNF